MTLSFPSPCCRPHPRNFLPSSGPSSSVWPPGTHKGRVTSHPGLSGTVPIFTWRAPLPRNASVPRQQGQQAFHAESEFPETGSPAPPLLWSPRPRWEEGDASIPDGIRLEVPGLHPARGPCRSLLTRFQEGLPPSWSRPLAGWSPWRE